ncbi:hypothetical protein JZ751_010495 [Albula glossodonta]|uniref:Uncharacterized protein n=1 Tax=Albula glossodonta TaxID=121402 RepID=A0A8T2P5G2_9TELE|nr:hypothetical protein JZ751_010495 [Albula glossodonta]
MQIGDAEISMVSGAFSAWWTKVSPYYTKVYQEMWVGVAIMTYAYYKLSYGGKCSSVDTLGRGLIETLNFMPDNASQNLLIDLDPLLMRCSQPPPPVKRN